MTQSIKNYIKGRKTEVISVRLDERILAQLNYLSRKNAETRNSLIEHCLAEKTGLQDIVFDTSI